MMWIKAICMLIGYLFGSYQTGFFLGKICKVDVRKRGSGNTGSTNLTRVLGWKMGLLTLAGDVGKGILSILFVHLLFGGSYPENIFLLSAYAGLGAVLGHDFPFYMKFKGGKGIATTGGFVIATCVWWMPISLLMLFLGVVCVTKYVSLGSLLAALGLLLEVIVWGQMGKFPLQPGELTQFYAIILLMVCLAYVQHRSNIRRLIQGKENKFSLKKK